MLRELLKFEWRYHVHKLLFLFMAFVFLLFGFLFSIAGLRLPQVFMNSPYTVSYILGILSMGTIFPAVIFSANAILRDSEQLMQEMVYATPVSKWHFLSSRFLGTFSASFLAFSCVTLGIMLSSFMPWIDAGKVGAFHIQNYVWPLVIYVLPNLLLVVSIVFMLAAISKNRLIVYLGGLFLYILYVIASMYAGAPWLANASPATAEAMSLASKVDPFGISAFFEQTRYWTPDQRNTELLALEGNFLFNRLLWMFVSFFFIAITYIGFSFRKRIPVSRKKIGKQIIEEETTEKLGLELPLNPYRAVDTHPHTLWAQWRSLKSCLRVEFKAIYTSLPFLLVLLLWALIFTSESIDTISGGSRMPKDYPLTGMLVSNLLEVIPFFGIAVLIFYSNEQIWRGRVLKMDQLTHTHPVSNGVLFLSKFLSLLLLPFLMISLSVGISIALQVSHGFWDINFGLYASAFYYAGLPLVCVAILAFSIQSLFAHRYLGLLITGLFILITSSRLSGLFGIRHPLLRYALPMFNVPYSEMNGFGAYAEAFHWRMFYWTLFALILALICYASWNRTVGNELKERFNGIKSSLGIKGVAVAGISFLLFLCVGSYIFYKTNIEEPYKSSDKQEDWSQAYEEKYKAFQGEGQPTITKLYTEIDLFPESNRYEVQATYTVANRTGKPIQQALISLSRESSLDTLVLARGKVNFTDTDTDETFGQYILEFEEPLAPGDTFEMDVAFHSEWNGFNPHTAFNSIVGNGSFIRISRYFPLFGYQENYELSNPAKRRERGLSAKIDQIKKLEAVDEEPYEYEYIAFEAIVSTSASQQAIISGRLENSWTENGRNYFHYNIDRPIPFRFAIASARYSIKKFSHKGIEVEIFYHPQHPYNIDLLANAVKQTLDYCVEAFGPYQYDIIRFAEVSDFTSGFAATAYPNTLFIRESMGFISDMREEGEIDILNQLVAHEVAHQWWAGQVDPAYREGGILLTETLAQYTEFMIYEKAYGKEAALAALQVEMDLYLRDRGFKEEVPLLRAAYNHPHIPYSKGAKVMYALREMIGEEPLNLALKNVINSYAYPQRPPTSQDLLTEILKQADPAWERSIRDMFEKILLYDFQMLEAESVKGPEGMYELSLNIVAQKYEVDTLQNQVLISPDDSVQIAVFKEASALTDPSNILYLKRHRLRSDTSELKLRLRDKPGAVGVDPFILQIDVDKMNNLKTIDRED